MDSHNLSRRGATPGNGASPVSTLVYGDKGVPPHLLSPLGVGMEGGLPLGWRPAAAAKAGLIPANSFHTISLHTHHFRRQVLTYCYESTLLSLALNRAYLSNVPSLPVFETPRGPTIHT